ncbi:uncharacterized protein LOC135811760 [Sycon ciliatum]|uniref:uncharacterized protein LOC135811760 n=1 Tax=Sycon ciliatum TaxID=27933 RepID=UPI0031F693D8|eukprot:scpid29820/ scgid4759/ 
MPMLRSSWTYELRLLLSLAAVLGSLRAAHSTDSDKKHNKMDPITKAKPIRVNCRQEFEGKELTALWYQQRPYTYASPEGNRTSVDGIVASQLLQILDYCCSEDVVREMQYVQLNLTDYNMSAANAIQKELMYGTAAMGFPVQTPQRSLLTERFVGVVPSPGAVYLVKNVYMPVSILSVVSGAWVLLCFVLVSAAVAGIIIWSVENYDRKHSMFARDFLPGIFDGFWFSIVTMTSVGFGDITPRTKIGKGVGLIWMVTGTISLALFTATVTTSLTTSTLTVDTRLRGSHVSVVRGSEALKIAILNGAKVTVEAGTAEEAIRLVLNDTCEGVVLDQLIAGDIITSSTDNDIGKLRMAKLLMSQVMHGVLFSPNRTSGLIEQCADLVMAEQEHETYLDVEELVSALQTRQSATSPSTSTSSIFSNHKNVVYITCYMLVFVFFFAWFVDCLRQRSLYPHHKKHVSRHHRPHHHRHHSQGALPHNSLLHSPPLKPAPKTMTTLDEEEILLPSETARLLPANESAGQYGSTVNTVRQRGSLNSETAPSQDQRYASSGRTGNGNGDGATRTVSDPAAAAAAPTMLCKLDGNHTWSPLHNPVRSTTSGDSGQDTDKRVLSRGTVPSTATATMAVATGSSTQETTPETRSSSSCSNAATEDGLYDQYSGSVPGSPASSSPPPPIAPKQLVYMQRPSFSSRRHASSASSSSRTRSPRSRAPSSDVFPGSPPPTLADGGSQQAERDLSPGRDLEAFVLAEQNHELERMEKDCQQMLQVWASRRRELLQKHQRERVRVRMQQQQRQSQKAAP